MARSRKASFFVAVVDDDADVRAAIESLLHSTGLRTRGFASAEAFLGFKEHAVAGCLILDMRLPGMSGLELHLLLQSKGLEITRDLCDRRVKRRWAAAGRRAPNESGPAQWRCCPSHAASDAS